jgi:serine/threonine protein kinase
MRGSSSGSDLLYTACGTPYYCAPEIINGAEEGYSGVKIDAWSCGIILYLLLTGTLPFQNEDMNKLYEQINRCKVDYPNWMPVDAKDLISRLLTKDPSTRYSLEDVKGHSWFLVDYESADDNRSSRGGSRKARSRTGSNVSNPRQRTSSPAPSPPPPAPVTPTPAPIAAPVAPSPAPIAAPVLRDVVSTFGDRPLGDLVKEALPGKPQKKIDDVVSRLEDLDIDCVEDIQFLAETLASPDKLTAWLEEKSKLPSVTCMRIAKFFFDS